MVTETQDRKVNIDAKIENDGVKRLHHERDEAPDGQDTEPRGVMEQAASDIEQGLVDTDAYKTHGKPGVAPTDTGAEAKPLDNANKGMRLHDSTVKSQGGDDNNVS